MGRVLSQPSTGHGQASIDAPVLRELRRYFRRLLAEPSPAPLQIFVIESREAELELSFWQWPREPGKSGPKEECADLPDGRVVRKVRTGMTFLLGRDAVAVGPSERNLNQVINLVNALHLGEQVQRGGVLCHAAGVRWAGAGLALAGVSGAGKSTLALHLMSEGADFDSNDRLIVSRVGGGRV